MKIYKMFSGMVWMGGMWLRIFGYGFHISTAPLLFSERYGYKKTLRIFGVKFRFLRPDKLMPCMMEIIYSKEDSSIAIIVNKLTKPCVWFNKLSGFIKRTLVFKTEVFFYGRNETEWIEHIYRHKTI